ncbi:MAG TPA: AAA family ATPase, partial [Nitriliruptorales bacterium]
LARVHKELAALSNQREVVAAQHAELGEVLQRDRASVAAMQSRGPDVEQVSDPVDDGGRGEELDQAVEGAREQELDARVELERIVEQVRHLEVGAEDLRREAAEVERALGEAARRREARQRGIVRCRELAAFCQQTIEALERSIRDAAAQRDELHDAISQRRGELTEVRERAAEVAQQLEEVREERHASELRRSELNGRIEQLEARITEDFAIGPADLLAEHEDAEGYSAAELEEREDVLVRKLGMLGRVNPLALEEFKALEERHRFLSEQLEDLRSSKRDLEQVIVAVDNRIREVFQAAFEDVSTQFERIFDLMFPGGTGRLTLTGEDDLLTAGIEVEARPPGKKVKRLSLLSGGERSLTVLAFVFAIFRARPSPFYVLDEVDAALDDANLQRLVAVVDEFKAAAQLIIVTHQRRTMEIADVLYGVTMGPDAVTKVVAERFDDVAEFVS